MTTNLYRQEALDNLKLSGFETSITLPKGQRVSAAFALAAVSALIAWICLGSYTRRVSVKGILEPLGGLAQVYPPRSGKVARVHVSAGTRVSAGTTLFTLSTDQKTEQHGNNLAARMVQLSADRSRIEDDLKVAKRSYDEQRRALIGELGATRSKTRRLATQQELALKRASIKQDIVLRLTPLLSKGYVSSLQYKDAESENLQAMADLESASSLHEDSRRAEANIHSRMKLLSDDLEEKSSLTRDRLSNVAQAIIQTDADREILVTSPIDGVITNVYVYKGSGTSTAEVLATIAPHDSPLIARLLVDSRIIGFVRDGTHVAIRYQSFPYEKFGTHKATVFRIPGSATVTQQSLSASIVSAVDPIYRIDAKIADQNVSVYGTNEPLKAGMGVTADLMLDRRKLIEWMFEPLVGLGKRMESQGSAK
ncbi:membrane fusion protein [Luteibacter sp. OK325]|uniref:HlyD family secretion protein n=1 Tax=Luteibacter sp. OK325 TaxID=2135670 RepID=UPI000D489A44|nr:HlyD family efflux transporter periplasmic adaptor subunit [Luteibacter sp. OK325]PTR28423.1 membrane fusion protein [Luteibacter sp. OK325]